MNPQFHDEFVALVALYYSGEISEEEWALLQIHMAYCDSCHEKFLQYQQIASDVIPAMAAAAAADIDNAPEESASSLRAAEQRLMSRLDSLPAQQEALRKRRLRWRFPAAILAASAMAAACLVGIRASEQFGEFGLKWPQVSLARKSLSLPRTKGRKPRHVPLNAIAIDSFKQLQGGRRNPQGPVFLNSEGRPLRSARDWFDPAVEKAGLGDYTWHCNRHTFASRLVMAGVDIRTVAQLMGHSTIQMTMRYAHLAPEHTQAAVDRLVSSDVLVTKSATGKTRRKRTSAKLLK